MLRLIITVLLMTICSIANAAKKTERVYFVRDAEDPVVIGAKENNGKGLIMRDPNLGSSGPLVEKKAKVNKLPAKPTIVQKKVKKPSFVAFKPLKISATLRMPRVEFGRVALPVGIREELPSTDFISKSLSEMP
jgi:hypothetical protein